MWSIKTTRMEIGRVRAGGMIREQSGVKSAVYQEGFSVVSSWSPCSKLTRAGLKKTLLANVPVWKQRDALSTHWR